MRNTDRDTRSELLDSLQQRIQTEKSLLKSRLDWNPPEVDEPGKKGGARRPRRTGRLYQVFLALSVPENES